VIRKERINRKCEEKRWIWRMWERYDGSWRRRVTRERSEVSEITSF
jgi:hypothetical protein